jgi:hypothetical protein
MKKQAGRVIFGQTARPRLLELQALQASALVIGAKDHPCKVRKGGCGGVMDKISFSICEWLWMNRS